MQSEKYSWSRGSSKIFATNNNGKLKEVREILSYYEILSLRDANVKIYKITRLPEIVTIRD